ncbi:hypothetical protein [Methanobacterium sp.]|uniref:hypothetical protein n=1 Tax=Methanobacterium sp. TaxID=2164 RepID=UPI003C77FEF3
MYVDLTEKDIDALEVALRTIDDEWGDCDCNNCYQCNLRALITCINTIEDLTDPKLSIEFEKYVRSIAREEIEKAKLSEDEVVKIVNKHLIDLNNRNGV